MFRKKRQQKIPSTPGVYMFGRQGKVMYVSPSAGKKKKGKKYVILAIIIFIGIALYFDSVNKQGTNEEPLATTILNYTQKTKNKLSNNNTKKKTKKANKKNTSNETQPIASDKTINNRKYFENTLGNNKISFIYPEGWKTHLIKNKIGLLQERQTAGQANIGEIIITFKKNPRNLLFDQFYDGVNDINYFADAVSGFQKVTVSDKSAYKFRDVAGYKASTIISIKTNDGFIEISDVANRYQKNKIFNAIIKSLIIL